MDGLACSKYKEKTGTSLHEMKSKKWPTLEKALQAGCIAFEDFAFADFLLKNSDKALETTAAFLCHLSRAVREGHLCISKKESSLSPSPHKLWFSEVDDENLQDVKQLLDELIHAEIFLPHTLVTSVSHDSNFVPLTPLCKFEDLYYFQKHWLFETSFIQALRKMLVLPPSILINASSVAKTVQKMKADYKVNEQQAHAILNAGQNTFSIICGGPGTGKTYTAGHLIKIFWESLELEKRETVEIALAAPTGKAAHNLQISIDKAFLNSGDLKPKISAQTLHSLLNLRGSNKKIGMRPDIKLKADFVLIDESSMIDVRMMSYLLDSIKPGARLILLGDPFQLPPVEAGSVFNDIIKILRLLPNTPVFELKTCLRAELQEIVDFSRIVNEGNFQGVVNHLNSEEFTAVKKITTPFDNHPRKACEFIMEYTLSRMPPLQYNSSNNLGEMLASFNSFRMLSPLRNGHFGVNEMNHMIHQKRLADLNWNAHFLSPIMIASNDYRMNLFNGEVGVLVSRKKRKSFFEEGDFAVFPGDGLDPVRKIPAILLPKFEYSYCLSVHKSQGSEFDNVLLLLPQGSERFGREIFYTAATRAKKKLEIWGSQEILEETLLFKNERLSGIPFRSLHN